MLKGAIIFASGVVIGASVTYIIVTTKYEKQYRQFESDCQSLLDTATHDIYKAISVIEESDQNNGLKDIPKIPTVDYGQGSLQQTADPFPFEEYEKEASKDPVLDTDDEEYSDEDHPIEEPREDPYLITEDEYATTKLYYGKGELYYFARDGIITDDEEEPLYDYEKYIGQSAIYELDTSQDSIYVRNERLGEDYLIVYCDKLWQNGLR